MNDVVYFVTFGILAVITLSIHKIRIPYIRKQHEHGKSKYEDPEYTEKIIKRLKIAATIFWILAIILFHIDKSIRYGVFSH